MLIVLPKKKTSLQNPTSLTKTRGQGPYRPAATRAMNDGQIVLNRSIEIRDKLYYFIDKYQIACNSLFDNI